MHSSRTYRIPLSGISMTTRMMTRMDRGTVNDIGDERTQETGGFRDRERKVTEGEKRADRRKKQERTGGRRFHK